ncbi:hypothetical protein Pmani_008938 [Petrolisthes manimaculis]|uniref:Uncharacterized protein n=1 Tax=Petrolisthes manimaculis TaxID=1843537 RepID=A0AAE1Q5T5_9EUCA|nr:hypothetical protein Pmani_008938 [Petrolisthes manimaculis]
MVATLLSSVPIYYRASFPDVLPISILRDTSNPRPCDPHPTFYNPCDLKEGSGDRIRAAILRMVAGIQAGILQVLQPASQVSIPRNIPKLFESFQQEQHSDTFEDFLPFLARKIVDNDCAYIEKYTRKQSESGIWKKQRIGAITASIFHRVVKYADSKQDNYIVNSIMGLSEFSGNDATKYGLRTEKLVKSLYAQHLKIILTAKSQIVGY